MATHVGLTGIPVRPGSVPRPALPPPTYLRSYWRARSGDTARASGLSELWEVDVSIESAYLVHSQVIRIGEVPLTAGDEPRLRAAFRPLFAGKQCFREHRPAFVDDYDYDFTRFPFPAKPFLRHLGPLAFDTGRLLFLGDAFDRMAIAETLAGERERAGPTFGFDPTLADQRMNHLFFEARRPLFLRATNVPVPGERSVVTADGRCFVHIYPSGYLVLHVALAFTEPALQDAATLYDAIRETRFWRPGGTWQWRSRLGNGSLGEQVEWLRRAVYGSLWSSRPANLREGEWHSALKVLTWEEMYDLATTLRFRIQRTLSAGSQPELEWDDGRWHEYRGEYWSEMATTDQGLVRFFLPTYNATTARNRFWEMQGLHEFVLLKNQIYDDYTAYLRREIDRLKKYRLNIGAKLTEEDVRRVTVYDPAIPRYLLALDEHIQHAPPAARRIYSFLSDELGFGRRRERLKALAGEWEAEAAQWEHPAMVLWRRLLAPLSSLLGK